MASYWSDMMHLRTCVYRAYIGDELAYVGLTCNPSGRYSKHTTLKPWWRDVDRITEEWFDNRADAKVAERRAILRENPRHNIYRPSVMADG